MASEIVLASGSKTRAGMLQRAAVPFRIEVPRIDEELIKKSMLAERASPRDVADTLAEMKARKISEKFPDALVIGCDQVLDHRGELLSKPENEKGALAQLRQLRNDRHSLLSAAVIFEARRPIWRHIGQVRLRMRDVSDAYIAGYVTRNWDSIRYSVGSYKLEEEGVRLFTRIDGDHFNVLGMPLLEILAFLTLRGDIEE